MSEPTSDPTEIEAIDKFRARPNEKDVWVVTPSAIGVYERDEIEGALPTPNQDPIEGTETIAPLQLGTITRLSPVPDDRALELKPELSHIPARE